MTDIPEEDLALISHITQRLETAFQYLYGYVPIHDRQTEMYWSYVSWQLEVGLNTHYSWAMWAATNKDLLAEWVLEFCIREWGM
jgi:hypothetical protein